MKNQNNMSKVLLCSLLALTLASCSGSSLGQVTGTIRFELNGGVIQDKGFDKNTVLTGIAGQPIKTGFPENVTKDNSYFVGWMEIVNGKYSAVSKHQYTESDGTVNEYYFYPYGEDTLYAYFEDLVTINFHLDSGESYVAPELSSTDFSMTTGQLSGYVNKEISSTKFLPTATAEDKTFSYWYSEYPLVKVENTETGISHYSVNKLGEKGEYRFDTAFESGMVFVDGSIDLYAKWDLYPEVTLHYGLDATASSSFRAKEGTEIKDDILAQIKTDLGIEYSDDGLYYPASSKDYKLDNIYSDSARTKELRLDITMGSEDIDIYFKWNKKISVSFDFGEGTATSTDALVGYSEETLTIPDSYIPTIDNGTFVNWTLDGEIFTSGETLLPTKDCTLTAVYEENPILKLRYAYPSSYTGTRLEDAELQLEAGTSIASQLSTFKNALIESDDTLVAIEYFTLDAVNNETTFNLDVMPEDDTVVYLNVGMKEKVTVKTYLASATALTGVNDIVKYFSAEETYFEEEFGGSEFTADMTISGRTYIYEGIYSDAALENRIFTPGNQGSTSDHLESRVETTIYRKMTRAIKLDFIKSDGTAIGSCYVVPNAKVEDYLSRIVAVVGRDYTKLTIDNQELSTRLPSRDSTVVVEY